MKLQDYWKVIKDRKKVVLMVFFTTVITTLISSLLWPAKYQGTATIMLDYDSSSPLNISMAAAPQALNSVEYINTQVELLESRRISVAVVNMLNLDKVPDVIEDFNDMKNGSSWKIWKKPTTTDIKTWLADEYLSRNLKIAPGRDSRFLNINFYAPDPVFAAAVANAYAKAYTDYNLELKVTPFKDAGKWFAEKLKDAKGYSDRSTEKLREYQQKKGIIAQQGPQGGVFDDAVQRLDQINRELATAKTKLYETQVAVKRVEQCGGRYDTLPEVQASGLIQGMKAEKLKLDTELTELSAKVGPGYPQYARLQSMVNNLSGKISAEMRTIVSTIRQDHSAAQQRVAALEGAVNGLKKESSAASVSRYEMDSLTRESETYKQVYEAVLKKYNETALQGDINKTNVFLVDAAVPPMEKHSPRILLNLILASFVGLFLGAGLAIYADHQDDTVKSAETLERAFGIAVLGTITSAGEI
ncbi:Wzz/FepE/Etk N-terminal domain-containing protein [Geomonas sp. RF6]|uniref:GNVR domain-containing protein n=1 Tax=Geomonas sp. RF6 TaxID=2897342 RepID=UPI001E56C23E|nr:GNVR domain-containing protein [Geomonas sp. RF6]UFS68829.1 Wzz/FepE/Etk N-terminal domain-containing protein [Geomonas sp. RF6]